MLTVVEKAEYFIKKPGNGRRSYAIVKRVGKTNQTLKLPSVDLLNQQLRSGAVHVPYVEQELKQIICRLRGVDPKAQTHNSENLKVFANFWETYKEERRLEDPDSAENDYRRAVLALGDLGLLTATDNEIQAQIDKRWARYPRKQRRIISRLQVIFRHLKRDVKLQLEPKPGIEVRHLSEKEMLEVTEKMEFQLIYRAAFYSGLRYGELFALEDSSYILTGALNVQWQIDERGKRRRPKRGKTRRTFIPESGAAWVREWCTLSVEEKEQYRHVHHSERLKNACRKAFPNREEKHCSMHDLRHSYAIHLLTKRFPLEWVAKNLGDSLRTAEDHYSGFVVSDSELEAMHAAYGKK